MLSSIANTSCEGNGNLLQMHWQVPQIGQCLNRDHKSASAKQQRFPLTLQRIRYTMPTARRCISFALMHMQVRVDATGQPERSAPGPDGDCLAPARNIWQKTCWWHITPSRFQLNDVDALHGCLRRTRRRRLPFFAFGNRPPGQEWVGRRAVNETRMDFSSRSWRKLHLGKKSTSLKHQYRREFVPPIQFENRYNYLSAIQYLRVLSVLVDPEPHEPVVQYSSSLWLQDYNFFRETNKRHCNSGLWNPTCRCRKQWPPQQQRTCRQRYEAGPTRFSNRAARHS